MLYPSSVQYRYLPYLPVIAVLWRCPALLKVTVAVAENRNEEKTKQNKYAAVTLVVLVRFSNFKFIRQVSAFFPSGTISHTVFFTGSTDDLNKHITFCQRILTLRPIPLLSILPLIKAHGSGARANPIAVFFYDSPLA